jgi:hypothetical protein
MEAGLRDQVRSERIVEGAVEQFSDELDEAGVAELEEEAPRIYVEAFAAHEEAKRAWPQVTDCDRLDVAFEELNERGILARHHWWCCQTCGHGAMPDERAAVLAAGGVARGYAFYHVQDTEAAVDGAGVCLAYGAFEDGDAPTLAIAHEVVDVLQKHGLTVRWDGSVKRRITVDLVWQRRARPQRWCEE